MSISEELYQEIISSDNENEYQDDILDEYIEQCLYTEL